MFNAEKAKPMGLLLMSKMHIYLKKWNNLVWYATIPFTCHGDLVKMNASNIVFTGILVYDLQSYKIDIGESLLCAFNFHPDTTTWGKENLLLSLKSFYLAIFIEYFSNDQHLLDFMYFV